MSTANTDPEIKQATAGAAVSDDVPSDPIWKADANADFWGVWEARKRAKEQGLEDPGEAEPGFVPTATGPREKMAEELDDQASLWEQWAARETAAAGPRGNKPKPHQETPPEQIPTAAPTPAPVAETRVKAKGWSRQPAAPKAPTPPRVEAQPKVAAPPNTDVHSDFWDRVEQRRAETQLGDDGKPVSPVLPLDDPKAADNAFAHNAEDHKGFWGTWAKKRYTEHRIDKSHAILDVKAIRRKYICITVGTALFSAFAAGMFIRHQYTKDKPALAVNRAIFSEKEYLHRLEIAEPHVLDQMVLDELHIQFARHKGLEPTEAQVNDRIAEMRKDPNFGKSLKDTHQTLEDLKYAIKVRLSEAALATQGVTVTDDEVKAFYDRNVDPRNRQSIFYTPETAIISAIITTTEGEARKALHELQMGITFPTVAKTYSKDQSAPSGGALPAIKRGRTQLTRIPGLENQIFSLKAGQVIGPVKYAGIWWIMKCDDRQPETTKPFADVKTQCFRAVELAKGAESNSAKLATEFADFRKKASILNLRQD